MLGGGKGCWQLSFPNRQRIWKTGSDTFLYKQNKVCIIGTKKLRLDPTHSLLFICPPFSSLRITAMKFALFLVNVMTFISGVLSSGHLASLPIAASQAFVHKAEPLRHLHSPRHLQTFLCKASDIATTLEDDFANFTTLNRAVPGRATCLDTNDNCPLTLITYLDENFTQFTEETIDQPCVSCDFFFCSPGTQCAFAALPFSTECFTAPCGDLNECLPPVGSSQTALNETEVNICADFDRSDSFAIVELAFQNRYTCRYKNEKRTFSQTYTSGVTNFHETSLTFTNEVGGSAQFFDICEYKIDGESCASCSTCESTDIGVYEVDCTNIIPGATSSCSSFEDAFLYDLDIARKWWILQDGFEPTEAPTLAPTVSPTESPTVSVQPTTSPQPTVAPTAAPTSAAVAAWIWSPTAVIIVLTFLLALP